MTRLFRFAIKSLRIAAFFVADFFVPKKNSYWIFPVYFLGKGELCDHMLAVFLQVNNDASIKKIVITRDAHIEDKVQGNNITIAPMNSMIAAWYIMRSKIIFVQHSVWLDLKASKIQLLYPWRRLIINLWHGIPIKDISHPNTGIENFRFRREMKKYYFICSSALDKRNMAKAFHKTPDNHFWITGMPRNDFIFCPEEKLQLGAKEDNYKLRSILGDRDLILYAPTYREASDGAQYYRFSESELYTLGKICEENNCLLGVRYHLYRQPDFLKELFSSDFVVDLSGNVIADARIIIRHTRLLITDYSSVFLDGLYKGVPCISFCYDYEHYKRTQRGFFYELADIFRGNLAFNFNDLKNLIRINLDLGSNTPHDQNNISTFFSFVDYHNAARVIQRVKQLVKHTKKNS